MAAGTARLSPRPRPAARVTLSGAVTALFLASMFLAPLDRKLGGVNLNVTDLIMVAIAGLLFLGMRPVRVLPAGLTLATIALSLAGLVSTFRATFPLESITQLIQIWFIMLLQVPIILTVARTQAMVRWSIFALVAGTIVLWGAALGAGEVSGSGRAIPAGGGSSNQLGFRAAYLAPLVAWAVIDTWRRRSQPILKLLVLGGAPVFAFLAAWALFAGGSRSATVATAVGGLTFIALWSPWKGRASALAARAAIVLMLAATAYGFYRSDYAPPVLKERLEHSLATEQTFTDDRVDLAIAAWRAFLDSPLVGVGFDNFRYVATSYWFLAPSTDPHNAWLQLLAQTGLVGMLAFAWLVLGWYVPVWTARYGAGRRSAELMVAFVASMTAIMAIVSFVPLTLQRHVWAVYGLGLAAALNAREEARRAPARPRVILNATGVKT